MKHIKNKVKEILSKISGVEITKIGNDDHITKLGFTSILAVQLISKIDSNFNVKLTQEDLNDTPKGLSQKINEKMDTLNKVKEIVNHVSGVDTSKMGVNDHISNLEGMQSILAVQLISTLQSTFNVKLVPSDLNNTPVGLSNKINEKLGETTNKVKQAISEITGVEKSKIGSNNHINDLGMQSILAVQLISKLESNYKIKLALVDLNDTPNGLANKINQKLDETTNKVKEVVSQLTGVKKSKIGNIDNISLYGMQSILAVQLASKIQSTFDVKLTQSELNDSVKGISQKINNKSYVTIKVKDIFGQVVGVEPSNILNNDHITQYEGMQSILAVQLLSKLQSTFNVKLTAEDLNNTPSGLADKINEKSETVSKVKELINQVTGTDVSKMDVNHQVSQYEGMQSILAVELLSKLQSTFNVKLLVNDLNNTPSDLAETINEKRNETVSKVKELINQVTGIDVSKMDANHQVSQYEGMQSILAVQLLSKLESTFNVKLVANDLNNTPNDLAEKINEKRNETVSKVKELINQVTGIDVSKVDVNHHVSQYEGMQSILAVQLLSKLQSTFNVKLVADDLNNTLSDLAKKINEKSETVSKVENLINQVTGIDVSKVDVNHHVSQYEGMQSILAVQLLSKLQSTFNVNLVANDLNKTPNDLAEKINEKRNETVSKVKELINQVTGIDASKVDASRQVSQYEGMQSILAVQLLSKLESTFNVKLVANDLNNTPNDLAEKINEKRNETVSKVKELINQVTGIDVSKVDVNHHVSQYEGMQSILAVQLLSKLESTFNVKLVVDDLNNTPSDLADKINEKRNETVSKVKELINQVTGIDVSKMDVNHQVSQYEGMQSILAVQLLSKIGSTFNVKLNPDDLNATPCSIAKKINEKVEDTTNKVKGLLRELSNSGPDNIVLDKDISQINFTSILAVEFVNKVNSTFGISLKVGDLKGTINNITQTINQKLMNN
ncbi:hypothetical protein ACTFIV_004396 [Dictyostelium citrinum]